MNEQGKKIAKGAALSVCAGLALSAIDAMASTKQTWDVRELAGQDLQGPSAQRLGAIADHIVAGPRASQSLGHSWFKLAERMSVDGKLLLEFYQDEGLGEFLNSPSSVAGMQQAACYAACYGNCYGNCYSNCFSADA